MHTSNVPTVPAAGEGAPRRTYADVVAGRNIREHEVAGALVEESKDTPWEEVWAPTAKARADGDDTVAHAKVLLGSYADSLTKAYFLTVHDNHVKVIYGLHTCRPLDPEGRHYAALLNDRSGGPGCVIPSRMVTTKPVGNERQYQYQTIMRAGTAAPTYAAIQQGLAADGSLSLLDPIQHTEGEAAPALVQTWKLFPVHAKVAALFMKTGSIHEAIQLGANLYSILMEPARAGSKGLLEFLRVAGTKGDGDNSALESRWETVDPSAQLHLEEWYVDLCRTHTPTWVPPHSASLAAPAGAAPAGTTAPASANPKDGPKRPYTKGELEKLFSLCDIGKMMDRYVTREGLPDFWHGFEGPWGKVHSAREYIELWLTSEWPADAPRYQHFVTTSLIQSFVSLDFTGGDSSLQPSKQQRGLSVYTIYPMSDDVDAGAERDRARAYEDTMDNHRPGEWETMGQLSTFAKQTPSERTELWKGVQYYGVFLRLFFGEHMRLLSYLDQMERLLNNPEPYCYHKPEDFKGYFWKYHCAVCHSFQPQRAGVNSLEPFRNFLFRLRQGFAYQPQEIPRELLASLDKPLGEVPYHDRKRSEGDRRPGQHPAEPSGATKGVVDKIMRCA